MPLIVSSESATNRHQALVIERNPPTVLRTDATGIVAIVGQFPWGPSQVLTEIESKKDFFDTFAPPGSNRLMSGYLTFIGKTWPDGLRILRVLGSAAAAATATLIATGPTNVCTVAAKYKGLTGNSLVATVLDPTDGDANHFNLQVSLTGSSGTTSDLLENVNFSGTGADTALNADQLSQLLLCGALTKLASGRPANGTYAFSTGADGTIDATSYVGTSGAGDKGLALLEGDPAIEHVVFDDPGDTIRAAVNAGAVTHAQATGNRMVYISGNNNLSVAATLTDKANYNHELVVYCDPWVREVDDVTGALHDVPVSSFAASVAAQLSPSTSIAWKATEVGQMLNGIKSRVAPRDASAGDLSQAGVLTTIQQPDGSFRFEAGVNTVNGSNPAKGTICRSRMLIYIARAWAENNQENIDAPNVPIVQQQIVNALDRLLSGLKKAQNGDPFHTPFIVDYLIDMANANTPSDIQGGIFRVPAEVIVGASIAKLILSLNIGETVTLSIQ